MSDEKRERRLEAQRRRNHAWYERNKEEFNAKRRARYKKDARYREQVKGSVRDYRERKANETREQEE